MHAGERGCIVWCCMHAAAAHALCLVSGLELCLCICGVHTCCLCLVQIRYVCRGDF